MDKTLPNNLYAFPGIATNTMERKALKEVLLETGGWVTAHRRNWDIKSEHLGAGVYKVWLELKNK